MKKSIKKWSKTPYSFTCKFCGHSFSSMDKASVSSAKHLHYGRYLAGTKGGQKFHRRNACTLIRYKANRYARPAIVNVVMANDAKRSIEKIEKLTRMVNDEGL